MGGTGEWAVKAPIVVGGSLAVAVDTFGTVALDKILLIYTKHLNAIFANSSNLNGLIE
jgi:hypothetical protein